MKVIRKLAIPCLAILSGCTSISPEEHHCNSYEECPYLIGSIKATKSEKERAKENGGPVPVYKTPPIYPAQAMTLGIEGAVIVKYDINPNGDPFNFSISADYSDGIFNKSAIQATRHFKFEKSDKGYKDIETKVGYWLK